MTTFMNSDIKLIVFDSNYICFVDQKLRYQSAVDSFMYVMLDIRFDIIFAVSIISRYVFNLNDTHWKIVKRIFRYLRHSLDLRLTFSESLQSFVDYIDVDWADDKNIRRFTSNYVFHLNSVVINWQSKRQATIVLFICEAEYMNQIQIVKKIIWLSELLNELQSSDVINEFFVVEILVYCLTVTIYCDNQNAQTLVKNLIFHARSKHIDIQQHFVKNKIQDDTLDLQHVFSNDQIVDDLIKSLLKNKFNKFRRDIDFY